MVRRRPERPKMVGANSGQDRRVVRELEWRMGLEE